jgi:adenylate cyclase
MPASERTPGLPEATPVGALSALSGPRSRLPRASRRWFEAVTRIGFCAQIAVIQKEDNLAGFVFVLGLSRLRTEMAETRKLAAIMAVDVVGYSRLMGEDEAGTARAVREHREAARPLVASRGGRIVKTMGDGLLLEFPSVVDAVECAIAVQRLMVDRNTEEAASKRIVYRIGVHLGDVLIEGDDIVGEGVNIAARLEGACEAGNILISGSAHEHVRGRIDAEFVDLGEKEFKNIERPVRAYRVKLDGAAAPPDWKGLARRESPPASVEMPSIAALPFENIGGDPEQDYFADGMVEDIITGLSRIKTLLVIARNSSFVYRGKAVDIRQVGRELGVRYILEGSVRKAGNRLRINAQLIEAETSAHLWAERFEGGVADVFDLQDQVTERVVGVIEPSVRQSEIERSRRKRPESLAAYDLYLRALPYMASAMPADARIAAALLDDALRLDPNYAAAHAYAAWSHEMCFMRGGFDAADRAAGLRHARAAISSGTDDATALAISGFVLGILAHDPDGPGAIERALSINPSCATALYWGALIYSGVGKPAESMAIATRALRLSPFDPLSYVGQQALGQAAFFEGRYDDAAACFAKAHQASPRLSLLYAYHAASLAMAGRVKEAEPVVKQLLELEPNYRARVWREFGLVQVLADKFIEANRRLGLPE